MSKPNPDRPRTPAEIAQEQAAFAREEQRLDYLMAEGDIPDMRPLRASQEEIRAEQERTKRLQAKIRPIAEEIVNQYKKVDV